MPQRLEQIVSRECVSPDCERPAIGVGIMALCASHFFEQQLKSTMDKFGQKTAVTETLIPGRTKVRKYEKKFRSGEIHEDLAKKALRLLNNAYKKTDPILMAGAINFLDCEMQKLNANRKG